MAAILKEATVRLNLALRSEKAARRDPALRQRALCEAQLASRGGDAELPRADDNLLQLQMRGLQLAARMEGMTKEKLAAARAFSAKRDVAWEKAVLREAKAYDQEAAAKRQAGRMVLQTDGFGEERSRELAVAKEAREREPGSPSGATPPAKKGAPARAQPKKTRWTASLRATHRPSTR